MRIPGPIQFILGDSAMSQPLALPLEVYDSAGRAVTVFDGSAMVRDSDIAMLRGLTLYPLARGITLASAHVGVHDAAIGVHVYQRVDSLATLDTMLRVIPKRRLFAVPLHFRPGDVERRKLPAGPWMLTMLPEVDTTRNGIHLRIENAVCHAGFLNTPRRFGCRSDGDATVVLYRGFVPRDTSVATGYLLVRWLFQ
jgi:hypothetical protein